MPQLSRKTLVAAKFELVYGVDSGPTVAANGQLMFAQVNPVQIAPKVFDVKALRQTLSPLSKVVNPASQKWNGQSMIQGAGTAGGTPRLDSLLQACQMSAAWTLSSVTYTRPRRCRWRELRNQRPYTPISTAIFISSPAPLAVSSFPARRASRSRSISRCRGYYFRPSSRSSSKGAANRVHAVIPLHALKLTLEADFANRNFFRTRAGALLEAYFFQGSAGQHRAVGFSVGPTRRNQVWRRERYPYHRTLLRAGDDYRQR